MKNLIHILSIILFAVLCSVNSSSMNTSEVTQTIRGKVVDQDSQSPLIGATIIVTEGTYMEGTITDLEGYFRLNKVPVGRVNIKITCIGYEDKYIPNILVGAGKEVVLKVEMRESIEQIDEVSITVNQNKSKAQNEMALVSAKAFTVEETKRYAGSFNDPARMVSGYAGVAGDVSGQNNIIVRGNSSKGILWRLDGMDIPNPNHFAGEGTTGGPINALNSTMLNNSDFYTGAFAPEYGNAYSGVFDMKLRNGNNEKREYTLSMGLIGLEAAVEGPFSKNYKGSYLINYRFSSLDLLDKAGIVNYNGVPKYQDLSFKCHLPTKKAGTFQIIGFGGISDIYGEDFSEVNEDSLIRTMKSGSDVGFGAIRHVYPVNNKTYITSYISATGTNSSFDYHRIENDDLYKVYYDDYINTALRVSTNINTKINARHSIKSGIIYSDLGYDMDAKLDAMATGIYFSKIDVDGRAGMVQGYMNWKYRIRENFTMVTGMHYMQFLLNNNYSLEPRLGLNWEFSQNQTLSFGFGIHSKLESISTYFATVEDVNTGIISTPNEDLGMSKSMQYVLGYSNTLGKNIHLKVEAYYQYLYEMAVENDMNSSFVLSDELGGYINKDLTNEGTGYNYGLELTLERFFSNNYYFLVTGSLYDSKIKTMNGEVRNSRFNGNYSANLLCGKEWKIGKAAKNRSIGVNTKISFYGGSYYTPVDLQASIDAGYEKFDEDQYYAKKGDDIFILNFSTTYRRNREKTTHEFKIDFQNATNNQAFIMESYNDQTRSVDKFYQMQIFPTFFYIIQF